MTSAQIGAHAGRAPAPGLTFALCLLGLTCARLLGLAVADTDLFFDEAQYWSWSRELAFGYFSKPPLIAWLIAASTQVCGDGEACVRAASPLLYAGASAFIYLAGKSLYDARVGFWAAIAFATLPGVSFSSTLISTDVPLLFFWSAALYAWIRLRATRAWAWASACGLMIGFGLLAKYAMVYFLLCAGLWLLIQPADRWLLRDAKGAVLIGLPLLLLAPNLVWNLQHGLVTFVHTADNANWSGLPAHPINALEFLGAQFGVFGPILFAVLLWTLAMSARGAATVERMLLAFAVPVLALVTVQAFLSRAHANWAATAYPAAVILVTAVLLRRGWQWLLAASLALHLAAAAAILVGPAIADRLALPGRLDPYGRMLGWNDLAREVRAVGATRRFGTWLTDDRAITAELLYYCRDARVPIKTWHAGGTPRDHYALTRAFGAADAGPVLLVSDHSSVEHIVSRFAVATKLGTRTVRAGPKRTRTITLYALDRFRGARDGR